MAVRLVKGERISSMKKIWAGITIMGVMAGIIGLFIKVNWVPGKYAVKESDFSQYEPYILVQEVHYTGTGWVQTGNEKGVFLTDEYIDINLTNGNILPQMEICLAVPQGIYDRKGSGDMKKMAAIWERNRFTLLPSEICVPEVILP